MFGVTNSHFLKVEACYHFGISQAIENNQKIFYIVHKVCANGQTFAVCFKEDIEEAYNQKWELYDFMKLSENDYLYGQNI
jgi:hypothetical protein